MLGERHGITIISVCHGRSVPHRIATATVVNKHLIICKIKRKTTPIFSYSLGTPFILKYFIKGQSLEKHKISLE